MTDATLPPTALREPAHQVSSKAPLLWAAGAAFGFLVLAVGMVAVHLLWFELPVWAWPVLAVVAIAYTAAMPMIRYRVHRWESTDAAVFTQTGWLSRERRIAPMSRVQTVDYQQTAVGRLFGLASVTVTTASAGFPCSVSTFATLKVTH